MDPRPPIPPGPAPPGPAPDPPAPDPQPPTPTPDPGPLPPDPSPRSSDLKPVSETPTEPSDYAAISLAFGSLLAGLAASARSRDPIPPRGARPDCPRRRSRSRA